MTAADIPAGMRLCASAGWNQLEEDWRFFLESPGSGGFLAECEGRVVGTVAFVRYPGLDWIAMMLVDPERRRTGIGARLMEQALGALKGSACVGLDATPLGEPLYRRFGFETSYTLMRTKAAVAAERFEPFAGGSRPIASADLPAVLARDREIFGADRSALLAALFARAPEFAWMAGDAGVVRGYCFGRPGRLFHQLGPVAADDRETARRVVSACFSRCGGRTVAVDAPGLDTEWLAWLESMGFAIERPFARMFLAGHAHPGTPERQYAIAGPEFA